MAAEASTAPRASPPTVGALLTRASAVAAGNASRECSSPRSLLSRILHRGRGGGFGCRLRLIPRHRSSGAAKEDAAAAKEEVVAPKVVGGRAEPRESPRSSLAGKKAVMTEDALPASLGLGASLVLLLSKSAAELSRMAELRAQMERLLLDARADVRSCNGRPSASDGHADSASVVREPIACAGDEEEPASSLSACSRTAAPASRGGSENAGHREAMDQMEAELEAELTRLQLASKDEEGASPQRDHQLEAEANKSSATSGSRSAICTDSEIDDGTTDQDDEDEEEEEEYERDARSPPHGGVSARELERRLHELLQSRHEARIAELETALERARRKLRETEREACRWRDTAKLATRFTDESRLR